MGRRQYFYWISSPERTPRLDSTIQRTTVPSSAETHDEGVYVAPRRDFRAEQSWPGLGASKAKGERSAQTTA